MVKYMNECNQMDVAFHMVIHTPNSHLQPKHTNTHTYRGWSSAAVETVPRYHQEHWWLRDILVGTCDCHRLTVYHSDDHNHTSVPHNMACLMSHDHLYTACNVNKASQHRSFSVYSTEQFAKASKLHLLLGQMNSSLVNTVFYGSMHIWGTYIHLYLYHISASVQPADWVFTRWTRLDNKWLFCRIKLLPWS